MNQTFSYICVAEYPIERAYNKARLEYKRAIPNSKFWNLQYELAWLNSSYEEVDKTQATYYVVTVRELLDPVEIEEMESINDY